MLEGGLITWCGDDQYLAYPGQHQSAERVVDHWFVVNRHQLFAHRRSERRQASAIATSEDDASALHSVGFSNTSAISSWRSHPSLRPSERSHHCRHPGLTAGIAGRGPVRFPARWRSCSLVVLLKLNSRQLQLQASRSPVREASVLQWMLAMPASTSPHSKAAVPRAQFT